MSSLDGQAERRIMGLRAIWNRCQSEDEYVAMSMAKYPTVSEKDIRALVPMLGNPQVPLGDALEEILSDDNDVEDILGEAQEESVKTMAAREAIASLPQRQRSIVQWTVLDGLTLEEVGNHLGVSKERVRQLREKALQTLREHPAVRRAA